MDIQEILQHRVSFQSKPWLPINREPTIEEVLSEIKTDKHRKQILFLRDLLDNDKIDEYNIHKKSLPAVTFCGSFNQERKREFLKEYNFLLVLDIDKLKHDELLRVKDVLSAESYVLSYWDSPSKRGIKGLVYLSYQFSFDKEGIDNVHASAFRKVSDYFFSEHQIILDESGSDTTRLCFLSFDPDLQTKNTVTPFLLEESDILTVKKAAAKNKVEKINYTSNRDILYNPKDKNSAINRKNIQAIVKHLTRRNLSITFTYEEWYKVAFAISNSFTYELGEKYFLSLCKLDQTKYDEGNCISLLQHCYHHTNGSITFSTIIYFANQKGYKTSSQRSEVPKAAT